MELQEYFDALLKEADVSEEQLEVLNEVLAQSKVSETLKRDIMARSDYSRKMDELSNREKELLQEEKWVEAQKHQDHNNLTLYQEMQEKLQQAQSLLDGRDSSGYLDDVDDPFSPSESGIKRDELKSLIDEAIAKDRAREESRMLGVLANTVALSDKHKEEFGRGLDAGALYEFALSKGLPIDVAYESMTKEERDKKREADYQKRLEEAKKEGAREALSKHQIPLMDDRPGGIHSLKRPKDLKTGAAAAIEAYMRRE